jgi:hypothetical protein
VNGLLDAITSGIYAPQSVSIRCSGEEAEQQEGGDAEEGSESAASSGGSL